MFTGVIPILLTPFTDNGQLDKEGVDKLIKYYVESGVTGLACFGEVSEPDTLSEDEEEYVLERAKSLSKNVPLIAGISNDDVDKCVEAAAKYAAKGVSGFLLAPPRLPKMGEHSVYEFYRAVDRQVDLPIIIHDLPGGVRPVMSPELIVRIVRDTDNVRYLKVEDQPTPMKIERLNSLHEPELVVLGASHGRNFYWELIRGAAGIMTSTPMPEILLAIWENYKSGNTELSKEIFYRSLPLAYYYAEAPVAVKKEVLKHKGLIKSSKMRQRSIVLSEQAVRDLIGLVEWTERSISQMGATDTLRTLR
jgi:4-hydroxy-tetrahydrodipicolinate synthase